MWLTPLRLALVALARNRLRTALTVLGIMVGIGVLMLTLVVCSWWVWLKGTLADSRWLAYIICNSPTLEVTSQSPRSKNLGVWIPACTARPQASI